jgi:FkbM family methyltransferase
MVLKMKVRIRRVIFGFRYNWTLLESIIVAWKIITTGGLKTLYNSTYWLKTRDKNFKKRWLKQKGGEYFFDFKGIRIAYIEDIKLLRSVFEDTFAVFCFFNDNYDKKIVESLDSFMGEGPYGYTDGMFDVTVKNKDIVIDVGAWIGDFSAYAAIKGATVYAFEPVKETFNLLCKTKLLNDDVNNCAKDKIIPVQKGLGSSECEVFISLSENNSGSHSIAVEVGTYGEKITVTTLDKFVEENKISRVDFIKADIEGAERDMLIGASNILKKFAPKLAICTYHLPDDVEVLTKIILEANPNYKIKYLRHKLFAAVL